MLFIRFLTFGSATENKHRLYGSLLGHILFQADHALYTPGLDENRVSSDFVHDIWICYEVHCTKMYMHLKHFTVGYKPL